jgi:hypothetical protein
VAEWQTQRIQNSRGDQAKPSVPDDPAGSGAESSDIDRGQSDPLPRSAAASEPTDAEIERGILEAVRLGLADVARTLSAQLDERRRARLPDNVAVLDGARTRTRTR